MSYRIETIPVFDKQVKKLSKKYPSFKKELYNLSLSLRDNPFQGVALGNDCYKIRMAISSKGKGKSKGARVITHILVVDETIHMLYVYDKSSVDNIPDNKIKELLSNIL
jgi:mRNA-degrading endonuclease RelE of RelBE toxin-antitoxin system